MSNETTPAIQQPGLESLSKSFEPAALEAHHAVVACEAVHDGLVEGVAHVQRACHIGGWQLDGKAGRVCLRRLSAAVPCYAIATFFPLRTPMGVKGSGLKRLGQALKAGLLDGGGGLVAHGLGI